MKRNKLFKRFLIWRLKHLSHTNFLNILSVFIGISIGIVAAIIKKLVHLIQHILMLEIPANNQKYFYVVLPAIGILLAVLFIKFILRQDVRHGIPSVLYSLSKNKGFIRPHNMYSSIVTSSLTVGFGGSVGLEGPTVATGAAIGSTIGKTLHLNYNQVKLLLGAACVSAMSAIFKAPIAAIVFALEVIMLDLTMASLIPLLLASASAALTSYLIMGTNVLYPVEVHSGFEMSMVVYYVLLGVISGLMSAYFTKMYILIEEKFDRIKSKYHRIIIGGSLLGLLIFLFPALYGEGYEVINSALAGDVHFLFEKSLFSNFSYNYTNIALLLLGVIFLKVIATAFTFGAGGVGGIFAPTLFMGVNVGLLFAITLNHFELAHISSTENFALLGMSSMISAVLHAPLTGIFLIGDISGGYALIFPLMISSTISYATVRIFSKHSVYTHQLAERNELLTHHKDKAVLALMRMKPLIETNFTIVSPDGKLRDLVEKIAICRRNVFPIVDAENNFVGVVTLDDVRELMFRPEMYDKVDISELMFTPDILVDVKDSMEEVANKFRITGYYNLPVVDKGKYVGFVSRANIFSAYRRMIKRFSED